MAKAHHPDLIGQWARENGFESIARNYHPQEREKRRMQALKNSQNDRNTYNKEKRR